MVSPRADERARNRPEREVRRSNRRFRGWPGVCSGSLEMRLVTYDRRGHRRLGAILDGRVVDLPDAVGHPAFPTTLEAFVQSSRGTVMDAARAALAREDVTDHVVKQARVLPPLFPRSLLIPTAPGSLAGEDGTGLERRIAGPEQEIPWPARRRVARLRAEGGRGARSRSRGRPLDGCPSGTCSATRSSATGWRRTRSGDPLGTSEGVPLAIGPCVVTTDELDPQAMFLQAKVEGREMAKGNLNGAARSLFELIAFASRGTTLERADAFALGPFPARDDDPARRLWPGAHGGARGRGDRDPQEPAGTATSRWLRPPRRPRALLLPGRLPRGGALGRLPLLAVLLLPSSVVRGAHLGQIASSHLPLPRFSLDVVVAAARELLASLPSGIDRVQERGAHAGLLQVADRLDRRATW